MKVYKNRFYLHKMHPGISGFTRWHEWEYRVMTGHDAQLKERSSIVCEYLPGFATDLREVPDAKGYFRLEDGHLPDHQPRVNETEMLRWLRSNIFANAVIITFSQEPIT